MEELTLSAINNPATLTHYNQQMLEIFSVVLHNSWHHCEKFTFMHWNSSEQRCPGYFPQPTEEEHRYAIFQLDFIISHTARLSMDN
jgi:hypothetical protein